MCRGGVVSQKERKHTFNYKLKPFKKVSRGIIAVKWCICNHLHALKCQLFLNVNMFTRNWVDRMMWRHTDMQAGRHGGVRCAGDPKQSSVACRDNHCKAPLSHSQRIKPIGLICRPTEYTHTHTHIEMPHNTYITHGPLSLSFTFPPLYMLSLYIYSLSHYCFQ